jgi:hypothetical protein
MTERRSQPRSLNCDLVTISWQENSAELRQIGNIHDVSSGGIGILVPYALPVGTPVTVSFRGFEARGIVKHTSHFADSPLIGIAYAEVIEFHPAMAA